MTNTEDDKEISLADKDCGYSDIKITNNSSSDFEVNKQVPVKRKYQNWNESSSLNDPLSPDIKWTKKILLREEFFESESFSKFHKLIDVDANNIAVLRETRLNDKKEEEDRIWRIASHHPYVLKLFSSFINGDRFLHAFEYVNFGNLYSLIKLYKILPKKVAQVLTSQIVLAVHFIHGKNIFHRNISTKNILISADGKAKLSNFNHSTMNEKSEGLHGHILYQAPEVLEEKKYDMCADWFSVGICLYEMVMGLTPVEHHCWRQGIHYNALDDLGKVVVVLTSICYVPKVFSWDLKSALRSFLEKNYKHRLGYENDKEKIKAHPFFQELDWNKLETGAADLSTIEQLWWKEAKDKIKQSKFKTV